MTPDELRDALAALKLSQLGAAKLLDVDTRTMRRWATGDKPIPKAVEMVLRLLIEKQRRGG